MNNEDSIRFTDSNGNPVSHEYFESQGYTNGLKIPGQMLISIKIKKGILQMACRCEKEEDFLKMGPLLYQQFMKENDK